MKLIRYKIIVALFTALLVTNFSIAQEVNPDPDPGDDPDIPNIPIDGGLSLLLVAGAAYGGKKVHDFRKMKQNRKEID